MADTLTYSQSGHKFTWKGKTYGGNAKTYSGNGTRKNKPASQCVRDHGPIPRGKYKLGKIGSHPKLGTNVIKLTPEDTTVMCGRSNFYIHGDKKSPAPQGNASEGCIVTPLSIRLMISKEKITEMEVVK
jgi:hypothetical protein